MAALATRGVGQALWYQCHYQEAIDVITTSIEQFKKLKRTGEISNATVVISNMYGEQGNYEKAFEVALEGLRISTGLHDPPNVVLSLAHLSAGAPFLSC